MGFRFLVPLAACLILAGPASADISYSVSVDTTSITGTTGSLDFNFNPGPLITQFALADLVDFSSDGLLAGSPVLTGDVSGGSLPSTVTFDNGGALNDYFDGFTFGSNLMFVVRLYGPAISSPDGVSTSGSLFTLSMFSDAAGTVPVLTSDTTDGFAVTLSVNLDGSTTPTNFSAHTTLGQETVPEPGAILPVAAALAAVAVAARRKTRPRQEELRYRKMAHSSISILIGAPIAS
jgi:hypothetical protein